MISLKKHLKGFTLVELIIVITILAILATIAFISFQGYTKNARDGNRLSTMKNIETGLELYSVKTNKYPIPDNGATLTGNTNSYIVQGELGESVGNQINLSQDIKDPLTGNKYVYSTTSDGKYYQIGTISENTSNLGILTNKAYASNNNGVMIRGNYKFDPSMPSLIVVKDSVTGSGVFNPDTCFIIEGGENNFESTSENCIKKSDMSLKDYDSDLVGYWDMETTTGGLLKDLSGNGNDGTGNGGIIIGGTGGHIGNATDFDGVNDVINFSKSNLKKVTDFTICSIINAYNINGANSIYGEGVVYGSNGKFSFQVRNFGNNKYYYAALHDGVTGWNTIEYNKKVEENTNIYYCISNNKNESNIYENGKLIKSKTTISYIDNSLYSNIGLLFNGIIDDIKIYNRVLTDTEIKQQAKIAGF